MPGPSPASRSRSRRRRTRLRLAGLPLPAWVLVAAIVGGLVAVLALRGGGGVPAPPPGGVAVVGRSSDPFSYATSRADAFTARATIGNARVLFADSPGGALATARRVAAYRGMIDRAVRGTDIDPNLLEGLVFVESAGRSQVIAGTDPVDASGLTQILAATGQTLLGMRIDLTRSRALTRRIGAIGDVPGDGRRYRRLLAERAAVDPRFDPGAALAATVRYLQDAEAQFGREDLAFESYHMGIGNLQTVLDAYDGGRAVPYVQLYFDCGPTRHVAAFRRLSGFGDDSWQYWWRLLGAVHIMRLYRTDRAALAKLTVHELADPAGGTVLHPPGDPARFADPRAVSAAYRRRTLVPLPRNAPALGIAVDSSIGSDADSVHAPPALYRGLRPDALRMLIELATRIRSLAGGRAPIHLGSTVVDDRYQAASGAGSALSDTGWAFSIDRRYRSGAQAQAFQELLDRLQSLGLIAWAPDGDEIDITVAADASRWRG